MADDGDSQQQHQQQDQPGASTSSAVAPVVPQTSEEPAVMGAEASDATTSSTASASLASSSSAATSQFLDGPAVPPREYSRDVRLLQYHAPTPRLPSQFLPRFVKYLALFIFISGTSATLLTVIYQKYLLPKLLLAKQRITALQKHNLSTYEKLLESLRSLVSQNTSLYPQTSTSANVETTSVNEVEERDAQKAAAGSEEVAKEKQPLLEEPEPEKPPREHITKDMQSSLSRLTTALSAYTASSTGQDDTSQSHLPEPSAAQSCLSAIETFSTYITNESFYASTPSYPPTAYGYGYGASTGLTTRSGADKEMLAQVKNDIRSLKGSFLTRRNFTTPKADS